MCLSERLSIRHGESSSRSSRTAWSSATRKGRPALVLLVAAALLAACGEKDEPESSSEPSAAEAAREAKEGHGFEGIGADRKKFVGRSGTATKTACELVSTSTVERFVSGIAREPVSLERSANDSLDLSFCEFRSLSGPDTYVKLALDTAAGAVRRYYNLIAEARQLPSIGTGGEESSRPELVRNVGDDGTYGGAGAFWIPAQLDLTSIKDERIVKVHTYVDGASRSDAREASAQLARRAFAGYDD
jgi:hypothetical protein